MLTRRDAIAIGLAAATGTAFAKASQPSTKVAFAVPPHACDCHTHVFGDPAKFPFWAGRTYTPETATVEEMNALHRALGIERVVIVSPSVYGTDNSATLDGLRRRGRSARGVAVIDEKTPERELDEMAEAGFRGIRINLTTAGIDDPAIARQRFQASVDRVRPRNWHIQINTSLRVVSAMKDMLRASPVPVVLDHFCGALSAAGPKQPGLSDLLELVRSGACYVKLSRPYGVSTLPDWSDITPLAKALIAANPDRMLWGTNWPHPNTTPPGRKATDITPGAQIDDGRVLNLFATWAPDAALRKKILVDNPARLYGW